MSTIINNFLLSIGIYGPIVACFLILIESIFPFLPLFVFITVNFLEFGVIIGFIISYIFTVLGCLMSYCIFKKFGKFLKKKVSKYPKYNDMMKLITKIKLEQLSTIIAVPFTPAFLVNICAGLSNMNFKKFLFALMIGKVFLVFFWGFVGTSLVESLTNPYALIKVIILMLIAYISSKVVSKKFNID